MPDDKKNDSDTNKKQLGRLRTHALDELSTQFEWSRPVTSFITPRATFQTVLQSLINHQYWFDAAMMLSHAMPQREAVWWAAKVCEEYLDHCKIEGGAREDEMRVLLSARRWVREPEEDNRMAAHVAASSIPNRLPSHWAGMAVFWATGNITPDAGVVTPPPPYLYARGVSAAIDLAASMAVLDRDAFYEEAIGRGVDVASGGDGGNVAKLQIVH